MEKFTEHDPQELIKELSEENPEFAKEHERQKPIIAAERASIEARMAKIKYPVGRGWWSLIDEYIPRLEALGAEVFSPYEKYGTLRIQVRGETEDVTKLLLELESKSEHICEYCGNMGIEREIKKGYIKTLCDDCYSASLQGERPSEP